MFRNYLNLTFRNLKSNKGYFIINLLGLTIGITSFILIVLWIKAETSYDKFHKNANNIYRVDYLLYEEGILEQHSASGSTGVGKEIKNMCKKWPTRYNCEMKRKQLKCWLLSI